MVHIGEARTCTCWRRWTTIQKSNHTVVDTCFAHECGLKTESNEQVRVWLAVSLPALAKPGKRGRDLKCGSCTKRDSILIVRGESRTHSPLSAVDSTATSIDGPERLRVWAQELGGSTVVSHSVQRSMRYCCWWNYHNSSTK